MAILPAFLQLCSFGFEVLGKDKNENILQTWEQKMKKIPPPEDYYTLHEQQRSLMLHEQRIKNVQPTLRRFNHLSAKVSSHLKKQPLAEFNRLMTIEIQNKALLKKLTDKSPSNIGKSKPHRLIKNNRKKNMEEHERRIENTGLSKRIRQAKSSYQSTRYAEQRKKTERILQSRQKLGRRKCLQFKFTETLLNKSKQDNLFEQFVEKGDRQQKEEFQEERNYPEIQTIISLRKIKIPGLKKVKAFLKGAIWTTKVDLEIILKGPESNVHKISVERSDFNDFFHGNLQKLIESIKYDPQNDSLQVH